MRFESWREYRPGSAPTWSRVGTRRGSGRPRGHELRYEERCRGPGPALRPPRRGAERQEAAHLSPGRRPGLLLAPLRSSRPCRRRKRSRAFVLGPPSLSLEQAPWGPPTARTPPPHAPHLPGGLPVTRVSAVLGRPPSPGLLVSDQTRVLSSFGCRGLREAMNVKVRGQQALAVMTDLRPGWSHAKGADRGH